MPHITIADDDPLVPYTAAGGQTQFDVPWPFFTDASLKVYLTPNGQDSDDANDILTLTTDYTVTGAGNQVVATRRITLVVAATAGDTITIRRDEPIARSSDLANQGDFSTETYNDEQDLVLMILQQLREELGRALVGEVTGGPFDALSRRIQNLASAVAGTDAMNKNDVVGEVTTQIQNAGAMPFSAPIAITDTPTDLAAYGSYHVRTGLSDTLNLPEAPEDGAFVRLYSRDYTSGNITISAGTGDYIIDSYMTGTAGGSSSGSTLELASGQDETVEDALIGMLAINNTNGETGAVTDNDTTTVTAALSGGESWDSGDSYSLVWEDYVLDNALSWGMVQLTYRASNNTWSLSIRSATIDGLMPHVQKQAFKYNSITPIEYASLWDYLQALDLKLFQEHDPTETDEFVTATTYTLRLVFSDRNIIFTGSSACTMTISTTPGGTSQRGYLSFVINAGSANVTIDKGSWTTMTLVDGGVVSTPSTITVPPGEWAMLKSNRVDNVFVWGSAGIS